MPSAHASFQPPFDSVRRLTLRRRGRIARAPTVDPRISATATLLALAAAATLAFALSPARPIGPAKPSFDAGADAVARVVAPVKFVGAAPRSDNCAEQVWPYIEQRCLAAAADRPKTPPAGKNAAPGAPRQAGERENVAPGGITEPPARDRATTGAAPADPVAAPSAAAREKAGRARVATAYLSPSRPRIGAVEPYGLPVPPGASSRDFLSSWQVGEDAWADGAMEPPMFGKPRRRTGGRAYRLRHGGGWGRRPFGFPF